MRGEERGVVHRPAGRHAQRRLDRERPDEDGEAAQHQALRLGQQAIAPVQRRLQGALPRRRVALAGPGQRQALVQQGRGLPQAIGLDPPGRQLDRQRHPVEPAADFRHQGGVRVAEIERGAGRRGPLQEQLGGGECRGCRGGDDRASSGGQSNGARWWTCSPSTRSASRLVARMWTSGAARKISAARAAAPSMTCSQLSSTSRKRRPRRWAIRPGTGSSDRIGRPSIDATATGTRRGSASSPKSTNRAAPAKPPAGRARPPRRPWSCRPRRGRRS